MNKMMMTVAAAAVICGEARAASDVDGDASDAILVAPPPAVEAVLSVDPGVAVGPIKPMNAMNSGPDFRLTSDQRAYGPTHFDAFRDLEVPMVRTHDTRYMIETPGRLNDIPLIFPDFDADENDPENYDFTVTDVCLNTIRMAGSRIMYFLGASAEAGVGAYGEAGWMRPPKDYAKWARVCEHVIRHYNEGWGWNNPQVAFSNQFDIAYWEIWNEPDLNCTAEYWTKGTVTWRDQHIYWNGTPEQFFEFYATVAKHLKKTFPELRFGGPATSGQIEWVERFLGYCRSNAVPIDFFTWHVYSAKPSVMAGYAKTYDGLLKKYGYGGAESILDEWNWNIGWSGDIGRKSIARRGDVNNYETAAFYAAAMSLMQDTSASMLMCYDSRTGGSQYNGVFHQLTEEPLKGYYAFYAWSKLRELGTQVKGDLVTDGALRKGEGEMYATAARGPDGALAVLVAISTDDANACRRVPVRLRIRGRSLAGARCHLTDEKHLYTDTRLRPSADGSAVIELPPNGFAVVELPSLSHIIQK